MARLTKKDFQAFVDIVRTAKHRADYKMTSAQAIAYVEDELADLLARMNPKFDRDKFAKKCERD